MSVHSCNEFCDKDIRLHSFQKNKEELELGFNVTKEMIVENLHKEIEEYNQLLEILDY